jgi:hypothetical protein
MVDRHGIDALERAYTAIVNEARAHVAAGRDPNAPALEARLRAAGDRAREHDHEVEAVDRAERQALQQLHRVTAVHRARSLVTRQPAAPAPAPAAPRRRGALRTKPTISGNMDVRRQGTADAVTLSWDAAPGVTGWEVRLSERPDARGDYVVREEQTLPATVTSVEVPLGDRPLRVHLLGRARDGRLVRRALISALTRDSWNERWQRRATAS